MKPFWGWLSNSSNVRTVFKVAGTVLTTMGVSRAGSALTGDQAVNAADAVATIVGAVLTLAGWVSGLVAERRAKINASILYPPADGKTPPP